MKAVYVREYGRVEDVVEFGELPRPEVLPSEVLIQVRAASVNAVDLLTAAGFERMLPLPEETSTLGNDVAGLVAQVGPAVTGFAVGDSVFAAVTPGAGGTFAEFVSVEHDVVAHKPTSVSFVEAASLPLVMLTAWQALFEWAGLRPGQRIVIHDDFGGVGSAAVQLARYWGAHVIGERFEDVSDRVDVVLDTLGGEHQQGSFEILRPGGVLVSTENVSDADERAERHDIRVVSFLMRPDAYQLARIAALVDRGMLTPCVERVYPLERASEALLHCRSGSARGKVVIRVK